MDGLQMDGVGEPPSKRQRLSQESSPPSKSPKMTEVLHHNAHAYARLKMAHPDVEVYVGEVQINNINRSEPDPREVAAGILHWVNDSATGFSGVLKHRYTDFIVHEIAPDGTVVHLTTDKPANVAPSVNERPCQESASRFSSRFGAQDVRIQLAEEEATAKKAAQSAAESSPASGPNGFTAPTNGEHVAAMNNSNSTQGQSGAAASIHNPDTTNNRTLLSGYFGKALTEKIFELYAEILKRPTSKPNTFGSFASEPLDREVRGQIHAEMRRIFDSRLETEAVEGGRIRIFAARPVNPRATANRAQNPRNQNQGMAKGKVGWNELGGEYLHFTLYKENKDTMGVVFDLARGLKINKNVIGYAGTKDRRAATTQRLSVPRQTAQSLARLNTIDPRHGGLGWQARVGNFKHERHGIELGELKGNHFTIILRDCNFDNDTDLDVAAKLALGNKVVGEAVSQLQADGFINYFGMQRFGTHGAGTDVTGKMILQGDYKGAVETILAYNQETLDYALQKTPTLDKVNRDDMARAHALYNFSQTKALQPALSMLPKCFHAETSIIRTLSSGRNDYLSALQSVSRGLRTMYVHAYQSKIWNLAASERWSRYGKKVIAGDLVFLKSRATVEAANRDEVDENGEIVVHPEGGDAGYTREEVFQRARALSAEEAASGKYTIYDIVLPTPGFDIEYPQNDIGDFYKEWMGSEEGGKLDPGNMRRPVKDFSLSGAYRKFMAAISDNASFEVKAYYGATDQLVETDIEVLDKNDSTKQSRRNNPPRHDNATNPFNVALNGQQLNDRQFNQPGMSEKNAMPIDMPVETVTEISSKMAADNARVDSGRTSIADEAAAAENLTAAHNAWINAGRTIVANEAAAYKAAAAEKLTAGPIAKVDVPLPKMEDTFIQVSVLDGERKRVNKDVIHHGATGGKKENDVVEARNVTDDAPTQATAGVTKEAPSTPKRVLSWTDLNDSGNMPYYSPIKSSFSDSGAESGIEMSGPMAADNENIKLVPVTSMPTKASPLKRAAEDISGAQPVKVEDVPAVIQEERPARIAVILKFALQTSQYATIALRELMKQGGVKQFKTEYSSNR